MNLYEEELEDADIGFTVVEGSTVSEVFYYGKENA